MPYQCNDNEPIYVEKLGIIKAIIDELDNACYAIVGDWNACKNVHCSDENHNAVNKLYSHIVNSLINSKLSK